MLKKLLVDSWIFFKIHVVALSLIILPIVVPIAIFTAIYQYSFASEESLLPEQIIPMAVSFIAYPIYMIGVVFYIASVVSGEYLGTKTLWKLGVKFYLPYIFLFVLLIFTQIFGYILLIIPGIIFTVRFTFSEFHLLLNKCKPVVAMRNSWETTKEYMWVILGGYAVIAIVLYVPYYLIVSIFDESSIFSLILVTTLSIVFSVLNILYTIFAFRVFELTNMQHNQSLNKDAP